MGNHQYLSHDSEGLPRSQRIASDQLSLTQLSPGQGPACSAPPTTMSDAANRSKRPQRPAGPKDKPKSAAEAQKAQLEKLFVDPSKDVYIPNAPKPKTLAPPREMIPNVQGSSAGAGSGEFHVYKQARRREYERIKQMDLEDAKDKAEAEFRAKQEARKAEDEARLAKNRAKRLKKKEKEKKRKGKGSANGQNGTKQGAASSDDDSDSDAEGGERQKKRKLAQVGAASVKFKTAEEREAEEEEDAMPQEEEIIVRRTEEAPGNQSNQDGDAPAPMAPVNGITIVDED